MKNVKIKLKSETKNAPDFLVAIVTKMSPDDQAK
jgi:hypothetical protein